MFDFIAPDNERLAVKPSGSLAVVREFDLPDGNRVPRKQRLAAHDRSRQVRRFEFLFGDMIQTACS